MRPAADAVAPPAVVGAGTEDASTPREARGPGEPRHEGGVPSPEVVLTGDAALDRAAAAWVATQAELGEKSPLMAMKLKDSAVVAREGAVVTVQMDRQMDLDWVQGGAKRAPAIQATFVERLGEPGSEIRYVTKRKELVDNNEAVELPVEGSRLDQLVKDMFGDGGMAGEPPAAS